MLYKALSTQSRAVHARNRHRLSECPDLRVQGHTSSCAQLLHLIHLTTEYLLVEGLSVSIAETNLMGMCTPIF